MIEQLDLFGSARRAAEHQATELYRQAHHAAVLERLRNMPVQELRSVRQGVRSIPALERAGYRTVLDVLRASHNDLVRLQGVGNHSAAAVAEAAHTMQRLVEQDVTVRLAVDGRDPGLDPLLRALRLLRDITRLQADSTARIGSLTDDLPGALRRARPATRLAGLVLARAATKAAVWSAVADVQRLLASRQAKAAGALLTEWERAAAQAGASGHEELWADFAQHPAVYTTLLERVSGRAADGAAAHGHLPQALQNRAGQIGLDLGKLRVTLRGYQAFGVRYALLQRRCILGDEMGLGKTIEAIAVCAHLAAAGERHFLVVCPASVVVNWLGEVALHSTLTAHRLHGPERDDAVRQWHADGGVAVTTFETLSRLSLPGDLRPGLVIVDEAQQIKNPKAQRSQAVAAYLAQAPRAVFLTGTPVLNRVEEFRNLIRYLNPAVAATINITDGLAGADNFRRKVADVYLRRNQKDVLTELPDLIEVEDWVEMGRAEARAYRQAVQDRKFASMRRAAVVTNESAVPAKVERLREVVQEAADNQWKVVVFSYFLEVLDRVRASLHDSPTFLLTGAIAPAARQQVVDEFSALDGHAVLISQITVGGVGLNLPAASVVVLTEPQLTPAAEEQAIRRCYRMGQTRGVRVHRLLARNTVDQRLLEMLGRKTALIRAYAHDSVAKRADPSAVDGRYVDHGLLTDEAIPLEQRIIMVERQRLGLDKRPVG
ncbi:MULTISPECIES: DEAD/DEAH box helicase [Micromonospora]|uniref:DEAD/DEAH box helicase n=1 Tax=Micromonospora TaxID=1873 RepID=UPI0002E09B53|nr:MULTISPECIES: DEAD/DEAH box helicase [Micromonospora]